MFSQDTGIPSKIQPISLRVCEERNVSLAIKREDLLHPVISGNKFRKLFFNIKEAKKQGKKILITFGGAYSNHILATAGAGKEFGFETIGIIRGEELGVDIQKTLEDNPTLREAYKMGMQFKFVTRSEYREKDSPGFMDTLTKLYPDGYILPEGGTNALAIQGCEQIVDREASHFNYICSAVGTGGTISGIINGSDMDQTILGFPALKGTFLKTVVQEHVASRTNWKLIHEYHFGGYAKITEELVTFINNFKEKTGIQLDPVYTGKMMFGILQLVENGFFPEGAKILAVHTGGLQGIEGMNALLQKKGLPLLKTE